MLGSYENQGIDIELYWIHVGFTHFYVYMSNILLLNYLIAIMSTTYASMLESGSFMFKVNLYNYCERYLIAFRNDAYGELAIHTAPINILTVLVQIAALMLPEKFMRILCKYFSFGMYWLENIIFILIFIGFELLLVLPVYVKNIPLMAWASMGLFTKAFNAAIWVFAGIPITLFIVASDVYNYVKILSMLEGCKGHQGIRDELEEEEASEDIILKAYQEARNTAIEMYKEIVTNLKKKKA